MQKYKTNNERNKNSDGIIKELQTAPSKIHGIENVLYNVDNCDCPECPGCLCDEAEFLYALAPAGMVATTPIMILCKATSVSLIAKG